MNARQYAWLDEALRSVITEYSEPDNESVQSPNLGFRLGTLASAHLEDDFVWSRSRRWIDSVDIVRHQVASTSIDGIGVLWWGHADNIGGDEFPVPLTFRFDCSSNGEPSPAWYDVALWSDGETRRLTPDGTQRVTDGSIPLPLDPFLQIIDDIAAFEDVRIAVALAIARTGDDGVAAVAKLIDSHDVAARDIALQALERLALTTGRIAPRLVEALDGDEIDISVRAAATVWLLDSVDVAPLRERAAARLVEGLGDHVKGHRPLVTTGGRLVGRLDFGSSSVTRALARASVSHPDIIGRLIDALDSTAARTDAMRVLGRIGPAAAGAIPILRRLLFDAEAQQDAAEALVRICDVHARDIAAQMSSGETVVRLPVARLFLFAPDSVVGWIQDELLAALEVDGQSHKLVSLVYRLLGTARPRNEATVVVLRQRAVDMANDLRTIGTETKSSFCEFEFREIGSDAVSAVPILVECLQQSRSTAVAAAKALRAVGHTASVAVERLGRWLLLADEEGSEDSDAWGGYAFADALAAIGPIAVATLVPALCESDSTDRAQSHASYVAGHAIREIGAPALPEIAKLRRAAPDALEPVLALGWVGSAAVPLLIEALGSDSVDVQRAAASSLAKIGPAASSAIASLSSLLESDVAEVRLSVAKALASMGPAAVAALERAATTSNDSDVLVRVARALGELGADACSSVGTVTALTAHSDARVRITAVKTLGLLRANDETSIQTLVVAATDEDEGVSGAARRVLQLVKLKSA